MRGPEATIRRAGGFGEPCRRRIDAKAWNLRLATHQDDPSSTETAVPTQGHPTHHPIGLSAGVLDQA